MNHLFIDVEALRLKQPWKAPLMQVGCVVFTEQAMPVEYGSTYVAPYSIPPHFEAEPTTLEWWKGQEGWPQMVRGRESGSHVSDVLLEVSHLYRKHDCQAVWFAGPQYDQVMLEAYYDQFGIPVPWRYNDARDFRTIRKQHPEIEYVYAEGAQLHDALADCLASVAHLRKITVQKGINWK